ncbi:protein FAM228B-like isoform X4 [Littorina saxatilis]|uniref:protein FAM228B-like isoform X4 n=1 Tax=Littorina saxatilis TaxID=31220 RepID=UPI0038B57631
MSSLLCVKSLDGKVEMHNKTVAEDLAVEDDTMPRSFMPMKSAAKRTSKKISKRPMSTPNLQTDNTAPGMDAGYLINNTLKMQDWIGKKQATDLQEKSVMENIGVLQLYSPLLDTEKSLVHDLNEYLEHTDLLELRKRELLHKNWNEKVYEPIRRQILAAMNGQDWTEKDRRRRELHCQYLEHVNRKGHVFLDTMDKGEYYAQALYCHRPAPITVQTETLNDPLLAQGRKRSQEDQTILRCTTGEVYSHDDIDQVKLPPLPLVPHGRHGTDSITWLEMPLGNIESTPRKASRLRMQGNCTQTQIDFHAWSKLAHDSETAYKEMQMQSKRMFEEKPPYGIPARQFAKAAFANATTSSDLGGMCPVNT